MDDETRELVEAVTEAGVRGFLESIAAPLVESGAWSADVIRRYRFRSQVKTLVRAEEMMREAGLPAQAVNLKLLVPLLDRAGLEADDVEGAEMRERWAALLANAAAGESSPGVHPAFIEILGQIEAAEARMLDALASRPAPVEFRKFAESMGVDRSDPQRRRQFNSRLDNLERLQLCSVLRPDDDLIEFASAVASLEALEGEVIDSSPSSSTTLEMTTLGSAFVEACSPPSR